MHCMLALASRFKDKPRLYYFIQDGHAEMGELSTLIRCKAKEGWKGVEGYQFPNKLGFRPVKAADILGYEVQKRLSKMMKTPEKPAERKTRKSLGATISGENSRNHRMMVIHKGLLPRFISLLPK
jgi:hypothetical protein